MKIFASIYIGSYEMSLKIFEISDKKPIKKIEHIRYRIDLGNEAFTQGTLGYHTVDKMCETLVNFKNISEGYGADALEVCASAVFRDLKNQFLILDQIYIRTGLKIKVISNSEQRFITYEALAARPEFEQMIETEAAIVDIGGAGIQVTFFSKGELITTQHLEIGTMRLRGQFERSGISQKNYISQMEEYIDKKLEVLRSLYAREQIQNVVFVNDYCTELVKRMEKSAKDDVIKTEKFKKFLEKLQKKSVEEICRELQLSNDRDPLILPSLALFKGIITNLNCETVWVCDAGINDGIAYEYGRRCHLTKVNHDFDKDVLSASKNMAMHYKSHSLHIEALEHQSLKIFDAMKKCHGMGKRERLLLQVAVLLHDCGKYISLANSASCAYHIIMSSEIIGLTHRERTIVGLTILYNGLDLQGYDRASGEIDEEGYMIVSKLSAILRVANALDQSHKQRAFLNNYRVQLKNRELVITVEAMEDLSLEQALFETKTQYFENVFSIKPVLKLKRIQ